MSGKPRVSVAVPESRRAPLEALFKAIDSDGSGEIEYAEIVLLGADIDPKTTPERYHP